MKYFQLNPVLIFNLHGSDTPGSACYFGDDGMSNPTAIFPHNLASARNFNILMTEACYGGRFIDYDKDDSMLLTAITNKTIEFLGSNVVAFLAIQVHQMNFWGRCPGKPVH